MGLHYIVCSKKNMFDVVQHELLLTDNTKSVSNSETDSDPWLPTVQKKKKTVDFPI